MKVVVPSKILPANYPITPAPNGYSNATDHPAWSVATSYVAGNRVIVDALQSTFEAVAPSTGVAPTLAMTTPWVRVGASNAWKPFDGIATGQLVGYTAASQLLDQMKFRLIGLGRFSTICVLNTDASSVRVEYSDPDGTFYDVRIRSVDTSPVIDAWTYFFEDLNYIRDFIFDGIDGHGSEPVIISVTNDSTGVAVLVGEIVIGSAYELGECHSGVRMSLVDYSRKEANAFGDLTLVERAYSYNGSFEISIPSERLSRVQGLVTSLRATPCVWFPSEVEANGGIVIYGFPRDFAVTYVNMFAGSRYAYATLEIEGLT